MFKAIILTFVITILAVLCLFLAIMLKNANEENCELREKYKLAKEQLSRHNKEKAYNKGLYDGRETDTIYRGLMRKVQEEGKATVSMKGDK